MLYESLINKFEKELIFRNYDRFMGVLLCLFTIAFVVGVVVLWAFYQSWWMILIMCLLFLIIGIFLPYTIWFNILKKHSNLSFKHFFNIKMIKEACKDTKRKDVDILVKILKDAGINTRPKVNEAIRHYQTLMQCKQKRDVGVIPLISLTLSICGIIFSVYTIRIGQNIGAFILILFLIVLMVIMLYIGLKLIYMSLFYEYSKYVLIERIESALSDIWFNKLI